MSLWRSLEDRLHARGATLAEIEESPPAVFQEVLQELGFTALERARLLTDWTRRHGAMSPSPQRGAAMDGTSPRSTTSPPHDGGEKPCPEHPHKSLELWDLDSNRLCCPVCITVSPHCNHKWTSARDAAHRKKDGLRDWVASATDRQKDLHTVLRCQELAHAEAQRNSVEAKTKIVAIFQTITDLVKRRESDILNDLKTFSDREVAEVAKILSDTTVLEAEFTGLLETVSTCLSSGSDVELLTGVEAVATFRPRTVTCRPYDVANAELPRMEDLQQWLQTVTLLTLPGITMYPRVVDNAPNMSVSAVPLTWDPMWKCSCVDVQGTVAASTGPCGDRHHVRSEVAFPPGRHYWEMEFSATHNHCSTSCGVVSSAFSLLDDVKTGGRTSWAVMLADVRSTHTTATVGFVLDTLCHTLHVFVNDEVYSTFTTSSMGPFYAYASVCCQGAVVRLRTVVDIPRRVKDLYSLPKSDRSIYLV